MTEHRTPDYRQSLSEVIVHSKVKMFDLMNCQCQVESELKKAEELAYINPELAEQEKLKGNDWSVLNADVYLALISIIFIYFLYSFHCFSFKKGEWANAVKFYSEAIKRNPKARICFANFASHLISSFFRTPKFTQIARHVTPN